MIATFQPDILFDQLLTEAESVALDLREKIDRLVWLKGKLAEELRAAVDAAGAIETFTEAEAGMIFRLSDDAKKAGRALRDLRNKYDFPFCRFGREIRYTRDHLHEICRILEINGKPAIEIPRKLRRAA